MEQPTSATVRVGVISDTHGLLRPAAKEFLRGSDFIIHGGDICDAAVLDELATIAPVTAVRGNNDKGEWARALPHSDYLKVSEVLIHVVHDIAEIDIDPQAAGVRVVVSGHSHKPAMKEVGGVLYFNPGSAGRRRFKLPVSVGEILIRGAVVEGRLVTLE